MSSSEDETAVTKLPEQHGSTEIVVVIGGAGFLGGHIVQELYQSSDYQEIRVFDILPFPGKLTKNVNDDKKVVSIVGSILDRAALLEALRGATAVIHTASFVDVSIYPEVEKLQSVNITGTKNILDSCIELGIGFLVYTSTISVVTGTQAICDGDEQLPIPSKLIHDDYSKSKYKAECLVMERNKTKLANGAGRLYTLSLRPTTMYGEHDLNYILPILKRTKARRGILRTIGDGSALFQHMYVGNCAWAHVCALRALRADPIQSSLIYFVSDDTPIKNFYKCIEPFVTPFGFRLSPVSVPYWIIYTIYWLLELFLMIVRPVWKLNSPVSLESIIHCNRSAYFKSSLAKKNLGYKPKYTYEESLQRSLSCYMKADL